MSTTSAKQKTSKLAQMGFGKKFLISSEKFAVAKLVKKQCRKDLAERISALRELDCFFTNLATLAKKDGFRNYVSYLKFKKFSIQANERSHIYLQPRSDTRFFLFCLDTYMNFYENIVNENSNNIDLKKSVSSIILNDFITKLLEKINLDFIEIYKVTKTKLQQKGKIDASAK